MASFYGGGHGDYLQAVVADIGQAYTKVGWAGNDSPKAYFRSVRAGWRPRPVTDNTTREKKTSALHLLIGTRDINIFFHFLFFRQLLFYERKSPN